MTNIGGAATAESKDREVEYCKAQLRRLLRTAKIVELEFLWETIEQNNRVEQTGITKLDRSAFDYAVNQLINPEAFDMALRDGTVLLSRIPFDPDKAFQPK